MPAIQVFDGIKMSEFTVLGSNQLDGTEYVPAIRPGSPVNYLIKVSDVGGTGGATATVASDLPHPFLLLGDTLP